MQPSVHPKTSILAHVPLRKIGEGLVKLELSKVTEEGRPCVAAEYSIGNSIPSALALMVLVLSRMSASHCFSVVRLMIALTETCLPNPNEIEMGVPSLNL